MKAESISEIVRRELTQQFYEAITATDDGRQVTVDFSKLPQQWTFEIPGPATWVSNSEPVMVNALDVIRDTMPGLWGYADAAGVQREDMCVRCGKCFPATGKGRS